MGSSESFMDQVELWVQAHRAVQVALQPSEKLSLRSESH